MIMLAVVSANTPAEIKAYKIKEKTRRIISMLGLVCIVFFVYNQTVKYKASREWLTAFHILHAGQKEEAIKLYEKLYPVLKYNQYFLFNYGAELSVMGKYTRSIEILREAESRIDDSDEYIYLGNSYEGIGDLNSAMQCYKKASLIMPIKFYPKYRLAKLYVKMGQSQEAVRLAKNILGMPVKVQSEVISGILGEMQKLVNDN
jgi:O-antigen polymerase